MKKTVKESNGKTLSLKELSIEIIYSIRNNQGSELHLVEEKIKNLSDMESKPIRRELLGFIQTYLQRRSFTPEEMYERIEKHRKVFAKYRYHEIRARAMMLLGSHYKHTYKHFPEALKAFTEVETIAQKHLGWDNMTLCETLFEKGGVFFFLGEYEKSTECILQAQALKIFSQATPEFYFKSHINVSRNYYYVNDPVNSKKHLELAEQSWEDYQGAYDKGALYTRRSDLNISMQDWDGALAILMEGLNYYLDTSFTLRIAEFYKELGEFYRKEGNPLRNFELSMQNFEKAVVLSKELNIPRLEAALYDSMWNTCKAFEEWKLCSQYIILHSQVEESMHRDEIDVYIKKLEHLAMVEKQKMMQQGKPTYSESIIDEVMSLRKENESLRYKNSELHRVMTDIELLIEKKPNNGNGKTVFLDQLNEIVQKGKSNQPAIESYLMECENSHPEFSRAILTVLPNITAMELKIAKLIKLGLTTQSIATLCGVTVKSIENHRIRLRKKCNLGSEQSLSTFIVSIK